MLCGRLDSVPICDRIWENSPLRARTKFSVEAEISHTVTRTQNLFYYTRSIFSMSPTSRRAVAVQKHLFVSERAVLKELLKQRVNVRSCTEILYSVRGAAALKIPLAGSRALRIREMKLFRNLIFNVWKRFSCDQGLFVGDLQACITLARNALWR